MLVNAASAVALLSVLANYASASPIVARDSINQAYGYLHVIEFQPGNPTPLYNKTASFQKDHLQIANPNYSFSLTEVKPPAAKSSSATVLVRSSAVSCLTAHKLTGPSYFYLDECSDQTSKTGEELTELKGRQYFYATKGGENINLALKGNEKKGWPSRPNVHVISSTQEVHATTENGEHNKQLYLQVIQ